MAQQRGHPLTPCGDAQARRRVECRRGLAGERELRVPVPEPGDDLENHAKSEHRLVASLGAEAPPRLREAAEGCRILRPRIWRDRVDVGQVQPGDVMDVAPDVP